MIGWKARDGEEIRFEPTVSGFARTCVVEMVIGGEAIALTLAGAARKVRWQFQFSDDVRSRPCLDGSFRTVMFHIKLDSRQLVFAKQPFAKGALPVLPLGVNALNLTPL